MVRLVSCVLATLLLLIGLSTCSVENEVSSYPQDVAWEMINLGSHNSVYGLIYTDSQYYINKDGTEYFAFCNCSGRLFTLNEEEIETLHVGNSLKIDHNRTITVERIDKDINWESEHFSPIYTDTFVITREPGRIVINDDYFYLHPIYYQYNDGHIEIEGRSVSDHDIYNWVLYGSSVSVEDCFGATGPVALYDDPVWVPVAPDCLIYICEDGERKDTIDYSSLKADYITDDKNGTCCVMGWFDDTGELYELEIHIDEEA